MTLNRDWYKKQIKSVLIMIEEDMEGYSDITKESVNDVITSITLGDDLKVMYTELCSLYSSI